MTTGHKVVIIGDSGVGKSAVIERILKDRFNTYDVSTIGAAFNIKRIAINEKIIELQLWDTAGQERFNSIVPIYLKKAHAVILVYAINDKKSQDDLIQKWYPLVCDNEIKYIYVVGNKCDLEMEDYDIEFNQTITNKISASGTWPATKITKKYLTSAKSNININDLFIDIASDIYILNADPLPAIVLEPLSETKTSSCCYL